MKKTIILMGILCGLSINAQWSLTGNSGTTPGTNFLGTTDSKDLVFKTNNLQAAKIAGNANQTFIIGMATPNPQLGYKLYVAGKTGINGNTNITGNTTFTSPDSNVAQDNNLIYAYYYDVTTDANLLNLETINSQNVNPDTRFIVKANGLVGIGTANISCASCEGYKLFVKDGIRTEKVKVEIAAENGWADYVFKKDYKLMPLKEVENYINKNGHLPEVPSTEEAIQNGIELKEMNILLLKKVEELTLHIIDQNKRLEELEANNKK